MTVVDQLIAILQFDLKGEQDLKKFKAGLDGLEKSCYAVGRGIGLMAAAASAAVVGGVGLLAKNVISVNAQFEKFEATLETIEGSSEKAKASLDWISNFAKRTPYEVGELTENFVKLRSYGLDPLDGTMEVIGNTASAMGKSLNQAVEAWADATTGEFERLKEFGIRAKQVKDEVTFTWNEGGKEQSKTIAKSSKDILAFLNETMGRRFNGAMVRQSKTWSGMMSNLSDAWADFMRRIGNAGFFDTVKRRLGDVLDAIARWTEDGTIQKAAAFLSSVFTKAADGVGLVMERITRHIGYLNEHWPKMEPVVKAVGIALAGLLLVASPLARRFGLIVFAIDEILTHLEGGDSVIGRFKDWLKSLIPASEEVKEAIANLGLAITGGLMAALVIAPATVTMMSARIVGLFVAAFAGLATPAGWAVILSGVAAAFVTYFWDDLGNWWNRLDFASLGTRMMDRIIEGMKQKWNDAKDGLSRMFDFWPFNRSSAGGAEGPSQGIRARAARSSAGYQGRVPLNSSDAAELREALQREAARIGADPEDLATLISFETAGTFNKNKYGPRTQHGQHKGLIQWGETQARQFGVDTAQDSISDQMRKVGDYMIANGYRPGMTGAQLYATVNAGSPHKTWASDERNGGTWGTAEDKWRFQMRGHRANARKLLATPASPAVTPGTPEAAKFRQMMQNYDENRRKLDATRQRIGPTSNNQNVTVDAPVTVNVQRSNEAPQAVGNAVQGALNRVKPSRMQASPAS